MVKKPKLLNQTLSLSIFHLTHSPDHHFAFGTKRRAHTFICLLIFTHSPCIWCIQRRINCDNSYFLFDSHWFLYFLVCEDPNIKESLLLVFFQIITLPFLNLLATTSHTATKKWRVSIHARASVKPPALVVPANDWPWNRFGNLGLISSAADQKNTLCSVPSAKIQKSQIHF